MPGLRRLKGSGRWRQNAYKGHGATENLDPPVPVSGADLQRIVQEADLGGRRPAGIAAQLIFVVAVGWSLFQLWFASPLPFVFNIGILNDTAGARDPSRDRILPRLPLLSGFQDILAHAHSLRRLGAGARRRLLRGLPRHLLPRARHASRPRPTTADLVTAGIGMLVLLEATRRTQGMGMVWIVLLFIHLLASAAATCRTSSSTAACRLRSFLQHMWLTTEGVFGVALGVSTNFVFLFVLFGALLDKAGGNNWMMQISIALLGHLRGGPAKVAVVSSARERHRLRLVGIERRLRRHLHHSADEARGIARRQSRQRSRRPPRSTARSCRPSWAPPRS